VAVDAGALLIGLTRRTRMNRLPDIPVVDYSDTATRDPALRRRGSIAPGLGVLALVVAIVLAVVLL
jgi:hypothetical protein